MFRFNRELILPRFFSRRVTVAEIAKLAKISHAACWRALNGVPVGAIVAGRLAEALGISDDEVPEYLEKEPNTPITF